MDQQAESVKDEDNQRGESVGLEPQVIEVACPPVVGRHWLAAEGEGNEGHRQRDGHDTDERSEDERSARERGRFSLRTGPERKSRKERDAEGTEERQRQEPVQQECVRSDHGHESCSFCCIGPACSKAAAWAAA
jgi:hypothetical protein